MFKKLIKPIAVVFVVVILAFAFLGNNRYQIIAMDLETDKNVVGMRLDTVTGEVAALYSVEFDKAVRGNRWYPNKNGPYDKLRLRHVDSSLVKPK